MIKYRVKDYNIIDDLLLYIEGLKECIIKYSENYYNKREFESILNIYEDNLRCINKYIEIEIEDYQVLKLLITSISNIKLYYIEDLKSINDILKHINRIYRDLKIWRLNKEVKK